MMYLRVLDNQQIESGRRVLDLLMKDGMAVSAAFWVYSSESAVWRFVIATEEVDRKGPIACYRRLGVLLRAQQSSGLPKPTEIDLSFVSPMDSYIKDLRRRYHKSASESPVQINSSIDQEAFVYTA